MKDFLGWIPLSISYILASVSFTAVKDTFQIVCFAGAFLASIMTFVYYYNKNKDRKK